MRLKCLFMTILLVLLSGCSSEKYNKYEATFTDVFDTYVILLGYAKTEDEFDKYSQIIYDKLQELHKEYDIYNSYEGINNLKTINDNAGIQSVEVSSNIIDMLLLGRDAYEKTDSVVNIAMGSVLSIWHDYRTEGIDYPEHASLPPMEELVEAKKLTDIDDLVIDKENSTVYLAKAGMSLDVGAIAKGYAAHLAIAEAKEAGMTSMLADIGGNICSIGKPMDGRDRWGVGIQDPELSIADNRNIKDTIFINDGAVVTSGSYQRYYMVDGISYNHIIDPETLMPADRYSAVSIFTQDSKYADILSTAVFIMSVEDGTKLLENFNAECLWIMHDGSMQATDGYKNISKTMGGYGSTD